MTRPTIPLNDDLHRALKETAARMKHSIASIIGESLRLPGIQDQPTARSLVDRARARSELEADAALSLAVEETRAARGQ